MNWFDNLKIKAKMILGFALFIVLITSIVLFAVYRLNEVALTYNNALKYPVTIRDLITQAHVAFNDLRTMTNKMAAYTPHNDTEYIRNVYKDAISSYEQAIDNIHKFTKLLSVNPLLNEEERRERLDNADLLEKAVLRYKDDICIPIMKAAIAGDYEKTMEILNNSEEQLNDSKSLVFRMRELASVVVERSSDNAEVTADQSRTMLGITTAASVVISIFLALLIASLIANPIKDMTAVANNIAKGNLDVNIDTTSKDETGELAKSFADIVNVVNLLTTELKNLSKDIKTDGDVDVELDAAQFSGAYSEVVESINTFTDALLDAQKSALLTVSTMFESNPQINLLFDNKLKLIDCNPEAFRFLRFKTKDEMLEGFHDLMNKIIPKVKSDGQPAMSLEEQLKIAANEGRANLETELHFEDGIRRLVVNLRKIPYKGSFAIVAYVFNITEIFQREMQLAHAKELNELQLAKLNLVVQGTKIGLWDMEVVKEDPVNPKNVFVWSQEFRNMLGYTDENDFPNILSSWSDLLHPEDKERTLIEFANHMLDRTGKTPYDVEYRLKRKTGEYAYYRASGESIRDREGNAIRVAGALMDITETKNMLIEKDRQKAEAEAANRSKSTFLANMSHELRTPLNVIIGLTGLIIEDKRLDKHVTDNLIKVSNAGSTLLSIVNDILDLSKIESGKLELTPDEYYTASMLNDTVTLTLARIGEKDIKFHLNIDDNLPHKLIGDDLRVKQVFTNLLTNAVKYTEKGSINLNVSCERDEDTVWVHAAISDTGKGIAEDAMGDLFLDYHRIDPKSNHHVEGTGLGLSITKNLVEIMGGKIMVESRLGKGSTFSFRIKQGFVSDEVLGPDVSNKLRTFCFTDDKRIVSQKLLKIDLSYAKVLVVDDIVTNLDVAAGILGSYKLHVDCLTNGPAAIERIQSRTPVYNAIFMDHMMPGMDGIETVDKIRALGTDYAKKIPIIALTANAIKGTEKLFMEHDFQAFITKPIDLMEMDSVLRKFVRDANVAEVVIDDELSETDLKIEKLIIEIPGVDTKKGLSLYAGAKKIYLPMLRSYAHNTPKVLEKLNSVSAENLHDYVITVHGLKGTSAAIGAEHIRTAALELENLSRAGDLTGVLAKNDQLIVNTKIIVANVQEWLDKNDIHEVKPHLKAPDRELLAKLRESCDSYDMDAVEDAMKELEKAEYDEEGDLVTWIREMIDMSKLGDVAKKLADVLNGNK